MSSEAPAPSLLPLPLGSKLGNQETWMSGSGVGQSHMCVCGVFMFAHAHGWGDWGSQVLDKRLTLTELQASPLTPQPYSLVGDTGCGMAELCFRSIDLQFCGAVRTERVRRLHRNPDYETSSVLCLREHREGLEERSATKHGRLLHHSLCPAYREMGFFGKFSHLRVIIFFVFICCPQLSH